MSIASRITEMETHIGNIYDTLEVGGADLTNVNKNIVNIDAQLKDRYLDYLNNGTDEIWNNWEKVTATNVNEATLNNTVEAPMRIELKGNTFQQSYTGKNLVNMSNSSQGGYSAITGLPSTSVNQWRGDYSISVKSNTSYTFWHNKTGLNSVQMRINEYDENGDFIQYNYASETLTITTTATTKYIKWFLYYNNVATTLQNVTDLELQLEKGSATAYEPYCGGIPSPNPSYPQAIHNVSGENNVKIENKNLFNKDNVDYIKGYFNTAGYITSYNTNTLIYIPIKDNTTVYIKKFIGSTNIKIGTSVKIPEIGDKINYLYVPEALEGIYNVRGGQKYLVVFVQGSNDLNAGYSVQDIYNNLQIEYNSTATTYIAHQEQNLPFTFETGQKVMQGTTLQDDGIHQKRKQVDLSTLTWSQYATNKYTSTSLASIIKRPSSSTIKADFFAEKYIAVTQSTSFTNGVMSIGTDGNVACMDTTGTPSGILEYELATEEVIPYTSTQQEQYNAIKQAKSYNEQTNISQTNNDLPFILDITALKK